MGELIIYPRGWLHNANVYGFLKVLWENRDVFEEHGMDINEVFDEILKDDGRLVIKGRIFDVLYGETNRFPNLFKMWVISSEKYTGKETKRKLETIGDNFYERAILISKSFFSSNKTYYINLIPERGEMFEVALEEMVDHLFRSREETGDDQCVLCGKKFVMPNGRLMRYHRYTASLFPNAASSEGGFPNRFWNMNVELPICKTCAQMAIFHHIVFPKNLKRNVFINAPSFKAIWYLNRTLDKLFLSS